MTMKTNIFIISMLAVLMTACASDSSSEWVSVKGNKFIDPQGNELIFRGLCFSDPVKLVSEGQWNERYFTEAADWGANVVRFAVHPTNLNRMGWEETFNAMDQGIEWAKKHGLYVIMDWHSIGNLKDAKYTLEKIPEGTTIAFQLGAYLTCLIENNDIYWQAGEIFDFSIQEITTAYCRRFDLTDEQIEYAKSNWMLEDFDHTTIVSRNGYIELKR